MYETRQNFNLDYYQSIIKMALIMVIDLRQLIILQPTKKVSKEKVALLRHDIDAKPQRSRIFFEVEKNLAFGRAIVSVTFTAINTTLCCGCYGALS